MKRIVSILITLAMLLPSIVACGSSPEPQIKPGQNIPGNTESTTPGYCDGMECALCGFITTDNVVIPPLGHTEENIPGIDATCTETGLTTGKYCTVCEETTLEQTTIPALGHIEAERDGILPTCRKPLRLYDSILRGSVELRQRNPYPQLIRTISSFRL